MATIYSSRHSKPLGGGRHAFGGGGLNLPITHLAGEGDLTGTFDDFQQIVQARDLATATVGDIEVLGWTVTEVGAAPVASSVFVNDPAAAGHWEDTLTIDCGTENNKGGNLQLNPDGSVSGTAGVFPHIWLPDNGVITALDNTIVSFAARIGIVTDDAGGVFNGKLFIGFAVTGDVDVMVPSTGVIDLVGGVEGPIVGVHINADSSVTPNISLIAQRIFGAALVDGTNFTNMVSGVDSFETGLTPAVPSWFDVGFRMHITNWSDNDDNGAVRGYFRRVPVAGGVFETANREAPGLRETQASESGAVKVEEWREHSVVLQNQCVAPNAARYVPTIEAINSTGDNSDFLIDWWSMGISRFSRRGN